MKVFKRILLIAAVICIALSAVACADNGGKDNKGTTEEEKEAGVVYSVKYNGTTIKLGGAADSVIKALGEPQSKKELGNCGGLGSQVKYSYTSIYVYVLETDSGNTVDQIEFRDDLVSTPEGISIGATRSEVLSKCGEASAEDSASLTYTEGKLNLKIGFDSNGKVNNIAYIRMGA